ncbi:STAS domain-containing protein [Pseudonocardia humida]|uniref:STAS domain-containing protein n=1 Tax=Pseudonocardia humida TaxID=2800819 RepID=A0ABT0ZV33_9PSEU|nr:STAS domain-containing protein [Pseudonocardia humida]MCO1654602.1 STAS domain-containing protein [Pseudonocardia humida]
MLFDVSIACAIDRRTTVVRISGAVDISTRDAFVAAIECAAAFGGPIELDLNGVTFFSAAGMHCIEHADRLMACGGHPLRLVVRRTSPVMIVLDAVQPHRRWSIDAGPTGSRPAPTA